MTGKARRWPHCCHSLVGAEHLGIGDRTPSLSWPPTRGEAKTQKVAPGDSGEGPVTKTRRRTSPLELRIGAYGASKVKYT